MSNNYIDFLEDSLREQTKMTYVILEQLKAAKEELRHYKTAEMFRRFGNKGTEVFTDDHRADSEES